MNEAFPISPKRKIKKSNTKAKLFKNVRFFAAICLFPFSGQMSSSFDWKGIEFLYLFQPKSQYVNGLGASRLKSSSFRSSIRSRKKKYFPRRFRIFLRGFRCKMALVLSRFLLTKNAILLAPPKKPQKKM